MRVLVTSARLPHAIGVIRRLGEAGHEVYATDTFKSSPGLHSKFVKERFVTPSPAFDTRDFVARVDEIARDREIDLVLPAFEEVFYLSKHLSELECRDRVYCSDLDTLYRLHNKKTFIELVQELDLPIAPTIIATSKEELRDAANQFEHYFGRAAFSRGGVSLLTNFGPLAGAVDIDEIEPSTEQPWIIQSFVEGSDFCSYSLAHHGKISAHNTYQHPLTIEHAGGIVFESIEEPEIFERSRKIIEHTGYHGSISFDWMRTADGEFYLVECNPRPTAGVFTMESEPYAQALFEPDFEKPYHAPADLEAQIDVAILRDMFREPSDIPQDLRQLFSGTKDVYAQKGDRLPGLYVILAYSHVFEFRRRMHVTKHKHSDLMEAQFFDIAWDGGEID